MSDIDRWRAAPMEFIETVLHNPETGKPFQLLAAERDFLAHAFTFDADGRLLYPEMVFAAIKKSGKTGFAAMFLLALLLLFGGRFAEGYCCANDLDQASSRVFQAVRRIVEASPLLKHDARITADKIVFPAFHGATISAIASDYTGAAGSNPTISVFDELWGFVSENSRRLWDEMVPPPTRKVACRLVVTYAGFSGESVLLEELNKRGLAQPEVAPNLHAGDGILMAWHHEPIAPWQTEAWIAEMRRSLRPNQFLRMIENRFVTSESSFVSMTSWDACVDPTLTPVFADQALPVYLAIDASVKHDSTAIVAVTPLPDKRLRLVAHRIFQPSPDDPLDFEAAVEKTLIELCGRFAVKRILCDPYQMVATAQRLQKRGLPIVEFPQTVPNLTAASQNLWELVESRGLILYPDAAMRLAASRAVAIETSRGWRIAKEKQSHKIDVIVALGMAAHAAVTVVPYEPPVPVFGSYCNGGYGFNGSYTTHDPNASAGAVYASMPPEHWARMGIFHPNDRQMWIDRGVWKPPPAEGPPK
jgi:phage terminase large subunit-like protein